jgi:LmbE family N-acetylglucosaminyl deacetylase
MRRLPASARRLISPARGGQIRPVEEDQLTVSLLCLSPHLDDAVLSCGGRIHQLAARGDRVVVLTLFTASPPDTLTSPIIRELHARWGVGSDAPAHRRVEDRAALGRLGAEPVHLAHWDSIYRVGPDGVPLYARNNEFLGNVSAEDPESPEGIAAEVRRHWEALGRCPIVAPLSAGRHVDHQIVHRAARLLLSDGADVAFYEDYPYAEKQPAVRDALGDPTAWRSELVILSPVDLDAKVASIACYGSQISSFWRDRKEMERRVRAYARAVGGGKAAERYWRPEERTYPSSPLP